MPEAEMITVDSDAEIDVETCGQKENGCSGKGRVLYCRKCEGHGQQVVLKGHAPVCPYILCQCNSCEKLMNKRLKSFNKRNKDKILLATQMAAHRRMPSENDSGRASASTPSSGTSSPDTVMSLCSGNQQGSSATGLETRSMSLGAMTVMSYDIWKAKCAADKKAREEKEEKEREERKEREKVEKERKASLPPPAASPETPMRKRAHTFASTNDAAIPRIKLHCKEEKKGRYVTLPTIPPMSVLIPEDNEPELTPAEIASVKSDSFTMSKPMPLPKKTPLPTLPSQTSLFTQSQQPTHLPPPTQLPTDQLLASMLPPSTIPTSVLLQNSMLLNGVRSSAPAPAPVPPLQTIDLTPLLSAFTQPSLTQSNILELLQRSAQLQQLTASLSALSPPTIPTPFENPLLGHLIPRTPLFSSTI